MNNLSTDAIRTLVRQALDAVLIERGLAGHGTKSVGTEDARLDAASPSESAEATKKRPAVAVLLTGGGGEWAEVEQALRTLATAFELDVVIADDFTERRAPDAAAAAASGPWRSHIRPGVGAALGVLKESRALVVPFLTRAMAAKVSLGIDDDTPSTLMARALERGVPVVAVESDVAPSDLRVVPAMQQGTGSLRHLLETYIHRLTGWGVRWTTTSLLPSAVMKAASPPPATMANEIPTAAATGARPGGLSPRPASPSPTAGASSALPAPGQPPAAPSARVAASGGASRRRFITKEDIWALLERGVAQLTVSSDDVVTLEAEEFAASRGVRLHRSESAG